MRKRLSALFVALSTVAALAATSVSPAGAQTPGTQPFFGYGSGATISANALQLGQTQTLNVQAAAAGQSTNSQGLPASGLFNELNYVVQPAGTVGNSFGRGTGLELGLVTPVPNPDPNQILLSGLATATAPPNTPPPGVVKNIGPVNLGGVAHADVLKGVAQAIWDPSVCAIGKPYSYGQGEATNLQLLGAANPDGTLANPLVGTSLAGPRNVSYTKALTYLIPNGDGTFGVVSETRQTIAPVNLLGGAIQVELLGEWALRAIATGKPGGARVEYAPVGAGPTTAVLNLTIGGTTTPLTTQQLFGAGGLDTTALLGALSAILTLQVGTPARKLGGTGPVSVAADGTSASGASDVVKLSALTLPGITGVDVRVGHMEAAASVPAGGLKCNIPVNKTATPNPVPTGQDFAITISIPTDAAQFSELFGCDLINIKVVDTHDIESGSPSFVLTGASNGGTINGNTVTWPNIGNYHIGDPPLQLTVTGRILPSSGTGVLKDTADVSASLGNCNGTGNGQDIVGQGITGIGTVTGGVIGTVTLVGPSVVRGPGGVLAATGGDSRLLLFGGVLLLGAFALRRKLRKPTEG